MKEIIKKLPIPICGLMLALAATGNLVSSYGSIYKYIFGGISTIILFFLILKIITAPKTILENFKNPIIASVAPTFSMGIMILSTYTKPYVSLFSYGIWIFAILIHCLLIIYFTIQFIFVFDIKKVFPSYFVVYVGIVVASVTAPIYNRTTLGQYIFWFGFISYLILLPIVLYRIFIIKDLNEPEIPTITIFAAPSSLCLAGYISSFQDKNSSIIVFLILLSLVMTFSVILYLPKMLKIKFYPSYSAFTFPFVISAIAMQKSNEFLISIHHEIKAIQYIFHLQSLLAVCIVVYVLIKYIGFFSVNKNLSKDIKTG